MLSIDEFGHVVYLSLDNNIVVLRACVLRDLGRIPSLVVIRADRAAEDNDIEDDDTIEDRDQPENGHFLSPCQPDVRMPHSPDLRQEEVRRPERGQPYNNEPPSPDAISRDFLDCVWCLSDNHCAGLLRVLERGGAVALARLVPLRAPTLTLRLAYRWRTV